MDRVQSQDISEPQRDLDRRARKLEAIREIAEEIIADLELDEILNNACRAAYQLFDVDHSALVLFDPDGSNGRVAAEYPAIGTTGIQIPVCGIPPEEELLAAHEPLVLPDVERLPELGPVLDIFHRFDIRSILIVPAVSQGRVVGSFSLDAIGRSRDFTDEEIELCQVFATYVALALRTSRLLEQEQRMYRLLSVLHEISDYIQGTRELEKILHVVLTGVTAGYSLGFNRAALFLLNEQGNALVGRMGMGHLDGRQAREDWRQDKYQDRYNLQRYLELLEAGQLVATPIDERIRRLVLPIDLQASEPSDIFSQVLREGGCLCGYQAELDVLPPSFVAAFQPATPFIVAPLLIEGEAIGLLVADNKFTQSSITAEDTETLLTLANTAAIAIQKAQLLRESLEARERLRASFIASNTLVSPQQPREVLHTIVHMAQASAGAAWASIILVDQAGQAQNLVTTSERIVRERDIRRIIRPQGISRQVMDTMQAAVIEDTGAARERVNPFMFQEQIRAALCLPFSLGGRPIGVMWLHYHEPRYFPDFEVEALRLFVNQAAIAYDNARQMEELEHMRQAAEALAGAAGLPELLEQIVRSACAVLRADSAAIWSYEEGSDRFIPESSVAVGIPQPLWETFCAPGSRRGQTARAVMEWGWVGIDNIRDTHKFPFLGESTRNLLEQISACSFQGVALEADREKLGVLYVNYNHPRWFSEEEQTAARTFAHHAALAVKKARLLEQVRKARDTAQIVAEVTTLETLENTLRSVVEGTQDALDCDAVVLYVYDHQRERINYPPTVTGLRSLERIQDTAGLISDDLVLKMLHRDDISSAENVAADPLFDNVPFIFEEGIASYAAIPLQVRERKVGVMFVFYHSEHRLSNDELVNMRLFGHQAAVAIHDAQLYEQAQARSAYLEVLYDAGRRITRSLELQQILDEVVTQACKLTGIDGPPAEYATLSLLEGNRLEMAAAYPPGSLKPIRQVIGARFLDGRGAIGVTGRAAQTGEMQYVPAVSLDPDYIPFEPGIQSELAVPLLLKEQIIGVLNVEHVEPDAFDEQMQIAFKALAGQAAVAIDNARAYRDAQLLQKVSASLAGMLEMDEVLTLVIRAAMQLASCDSGTVLFWDENGQSFTPAYTLKGEHQKLTHYQTSARVGGLAWTILHEQETIVIADARHDTRVSEVAHRKGRQALIGVPLSGHTQAFAVLYVSNSEPLQFSTHQVALVQTLASHAAVAIEKARRYLELRHTYEELKEVKGVVGARTAVAWMGMTSSVWRHAIDGYALTIGGEIELLRHELSLGSSYEAIEARLDKINWQVSKILAHPITPPLSDTEGVQAVPIHDLLRERAIQLSEHPFYSDIQFDFDLHLSETATVRASPHWLRQIIDILVDNAVEAMHDVAQKKLAIATGRVGHSVQINFTDYGRGIAQETVPLLFHEPIQGTSGMGMGLLLAETMAQAYGGHLFVAGTTPAGTTIALWLPLETT